MLKGFLSIGGVALAGTHGSAEAARRPTPTPKPIRCPGSQYWDGSSCVCSSGAPCGPDCCDSAALCCDNACCASGQVCTWEEVCCTPSCEPGICGDDGCGGQCGCPEGICLDGLCFRTVPSGGNCSEGTSCGQFFYPDFDVCVGGTNGQTCTPGSCVTGLACLPEPISVCYLPCW